MLWGMVFNSFFAYFLNSLFSAKLISYPSYEQLLDILPTFIHIAIMAVLAFAIGQVAPSNLFLSLILKTSVALGYLFTAGYLFKIPEFLELKDLLKEQIKLHFGILKLKKADA